MNARLDPRRWSLGLRLTLFFFAASSTILCVVALLMDDQLRHQIHEKDELDVRSTIAVQLGIMRAMEGERGNDRWQQEWSEHMQGMKRYGLRLVAPGGTVSAESTGLDIPREAFPPPRPRSSLRPYERDTADGTRHYVLAASSVEVRPGQVWLLQAAFDVSESMEILETFRQRLILVVVAAIALASALGGWLVRRGLAPLRTMSRSIALIDAERLHERIGEQPWPADLRVLAESFDDMLRRLEAAFEQLSRFSSDLAHEFRSPITNLVAAASVMLARERSAAEYQETLGVIVGEGERLSRMVSSMLFLARADNARQALQIEPLAVGRQFAEIIDIYEALAEERQVRIVAEGDAGVMADPLLLRRALSNLVGNALQHTPAGGLITLGATTAGDTVRISVSDTGSGIAAQHLPHIFERFYRADPARSSGENTGLGLAVVKSIVELHGGEVQVESAPARGARFTLNLGAALGPG